MAHRCDQAHVANFAVTWHYDDGVQFFQGPEDLNPVRAT